MYLNEFNKSGIIPFKSQKDLAQKMTKLALQNIPHLRTYEAF
jgi:hypothetical protein